MIPNIELLKRHKIARDAGILSQDEFMQLYQSIMNEGSNNQLVPLSSSTSSTISPQPKPVLESSVIQAGSSSFLQSSAISVPIVSEDSGPDKVILLVDIMLLLERPSARETICYGYHLSY